MSLGTFSSGWRGSKDSFHAEPVLARKVLKTVVFFGMLKMMMTYFLAEYTVLCMSMATVMGPTPPGTGVMWLATSATSL